MLKKYLKILIFSFCFYLHLNYYFQSSSSESNSEKIVGGTSANIEAFPYQVMLMWSTSNAPVCGGSLIGNPQEASTVWVLTAAHCTTYDLFVKAGVDYSLEGSQEKIAVKRVIVHPFYNPQTLENDLALLELTNPIFFNSKKQAVSIPWDDGHLLKQTLTVTGFGRLSYGGSVPTHLQQAQIHYVPLKEAAKDYEVYAYFSEKRLLTAGEKGKDACQGDSGGPLVAFDESKKPFLVGVVSFGPPSCGQMAGAYTRVNYFADWISAHTNILPFFNNISTSLPEKIWGTAELYFPDFRADLMTWTTSENLKLLDFREDHVTVQVLTKGQGRIFGFYKGQLVFEHAMELNTEFENSTFGCRRKK